MIELLAVLALVALVAGAALTRFGTQTVSNVSGDGFARRLALDLIQARRRTLASGSPLGAWVTTPDKADVVTPWAWAAPAPNKTNAATMIARLTRPLQRLISSSRDLGQDGWNQRALKRCRVPNGPLSCTS